MSATARAAPLLVPPAAVVYSRFLLTHLPDPAAAVRTWAGALLAGAGLAVEEAGAAATPLPAARMARLHAMNLRTWGADEHARRAFDAAELASLQRTLDAIAAGEEPAPPVHGEMGQAVGRRA